VTRPTHRARSRPKCESSVLRDRLPHFAGGWLSVGRREREQVEARVRFSDPLDLVSFPPLGPGPSVHCGRCGCGLGCEDWSRGGVGSLFWLSVVHPCRRLSTRSQTRGSLIPTCPTFPQGTDAALRHRCPRLPGVSPVCSRRAG
jgi:hypothetical protein